MRPYPTALCRVILPLFLPFAIVLGTSTAHGVQDAAAPTTHTTDNTATPPVEPTWSDVAGKLAPGVYDAGDMPLLVIHDGKRHKDVHLRVRFPKTKAATVAKSADGPFPLIVFSHGMGASKDGFAALSAYLATHGYVVIHPTHADSITLRHDTDKEVEPHTGHPRPRLRDMESIRRPRVADVDPYDRVADVSFIYDSIDQIERAIDDLRLPDGGGKIDRARLGIAGHSAGAMTAQMAVGANVRGGGLRVAVDEEDDDVSIGDEAEGKWILSSYAEPRCKAGVAISSQGTTNRLFTEDSWKSVAAPMLDIGGSNDQLPGRDTTARRKDAYEYSPGTSAGGPPVYLLFIEGAYHSTYAGGRADSDELRQMAVTTTHAATLALFDAYLKNDASAKHFLASPDGMNAVSKGKAELEAK